MEKCKKLNPTVLRSKSLLKDALLSLLAEDLLADITVAQICARAQLTRPTFYNHYASKEDLAAEVIRDSLDEFVRYIGQSRIESTEGMLRAFLGYWDSHWELLQMMSKNDLLPTLGKCFRPHLEHIYSTASFTNKKLSSAELAFHNAFLSAGIAGMLEHWAQEKPPTNAESVAVYLENMLAALHAGKGSAPGAWK